MSAKLEALAQAIGGTIVKAGGDIHNDNKYAAGLARLNRVLVEALYETHKHAMPIDADDTLSHKRVEEIWTSMNIGLHRFVNACLNGDVRNEDVGQIYGVVKSVVDHILSLSKALDIDPKLRRKFVADYVPTLKSMLARLKAGKLVASGLTPIVDSISRLAYLNMRYYSTQD